MTVLRLLQQAEDNDELDDASIIGDKGMYFVGLERIAKSTVDRLLMVTAIREASFSGGCELYELNDVGRAILRRPELVEEVRAALLSGRNFTVTNDHVQFLTPAR